MGTPKQAGSFPSCSVHRAVARKMHRTRHNFSNSERHSLSFTGGGIDPCLGCKPLGKHLEPCFFVGFVQEQDKEYPTKLPLLYVS